MLYERWPALFYTANKDMLKQTASLFRSSRQPISYNPLTLCINVEPLRYTGRAEHRPAVQEVCRIAHR